MTEPSAQKQMEELYLPEGGGEIRYSSQSATPCAQIMMKSMRTPSCQRCGVQARRGDEIVDIAKCHLIPLSAHWKNREIVYASRNDGAARQRASIFNPKDGWKAERPG